MKIVPENQDVSLLKGPEVPAVEDVVVDFVAGAALFVQHLDLPEIVYLVFDHAVGLVILRKLCEKGHELAKGDERHVANLVKCEYINKKIKEIIIKIIFFFLNF